FFLFGGRDRLGAGQRRLDAAEGTTANFLPIIVAAGVTVAAGTAALVVARLEFVRAFGPALALTVAISLAVAITFVPAALAVFGRALFWPYGVVAAGHPQIAGAGWRGRLSRMLTSRPVAFLIAVLILAGLGVAAYGLRSARLGWTLIRDLPPDTQERQADAAASRGFADGILSPTEILLEGTGLDGQKAALARLEELVGRQR